MPYPPITPLPTPPSRSQSPATFSADADTFLGALPDFQSDANALAAYLDALAAGADTDAATAAAAAAAALVSEGNAATSEANAAASEAIAVASASAAAASYDSFDDRYLGSKASDPSVDNDGNPLLTGALYWNSTSNQMRVYSGTTWEVSYLPASAYVVGPASATDGNLAVFDGATGKIVKDGGTLANYVQGPASAATNTIPLYDGATGKLLKASLGSGTAGQALVSGGAGQAPNWGDISSVVQFPQNVKSTDYTLVLSDAGKQIFHPASDASSRTYTIPANASVAYPIGTVLLFTVENGGQPVTVNIDSDTLTLGDGTTAPVRVGANNTLMAIKVTSTSWMANFLWSGSPSTFVAFSISNSTNVRVFSWDQNGFGSLYAPPSSLPTGNVEDIAFHPDGYALAIAHITSPYVTVYNWGPLGFGDKYANPGVASSNGRSIAFSTKGDALVVGLESSPYIAARRWSVNGFGTAFSNPSTLPQGRVNSIAFAPNDAAVACIDSSNPYVSVYAWSSSGFGTRYADPPLSTDSLGAVAFSPSGTEIAMSGSTFSGQSGFYVYRWSNSTGFGSRFSNPATIPAGGSGVYSVAFSPSGDAIAWAASSSPYIWVYPWSSGGFGTRYANPSTLGTTSCNDVAFSPDGKSIVAAGGLTDRSLAYRWSSSGFGTKYAEPASAGAPLTHVAFGQYT